MELLQDRGTDLWPFPHGRSHPPGLQGPCCHFRWQASIWEKKEYHPLPQKPLSLWDLLGSGPPKDRLWSRPKEQDHREGAFLKWGLMRTRKKPIWIKHERAKWPESSQNQSEDFKPLSPKSKISQQRRNWDSCLLGRFFHHFWGIREAVRCWLGEEAGPGTWGRRGAPGKSLPYTPLGVPSPTEAGRDTSLGEKAETAETSE